MVDRVAKKISINIFQGERGRGAQLNGLADAP